MKSGAKVLIGATVVGLTGLGIFLATNSASASPKKGSGGKTPKGSGGGKKPSGGGKKPSGGGDSPKGGGSGHHTGGGGEVIFGDYDGPLPDDFEPSGNQVRVSQDCSVVVVGAGFWPNSFEINAIEPNDGTLKGTLRIPGNSVVGYIDYLYDTEGVHDYKVIGARILLEISEHCANMSPSSWPPAFADFADWLYERLRTYVQESGGNLQPGDVGLDTSNGGG